MGKIIIDGNSFFEIDEECLKNKKILKKCGLEKYYRSDNNNNKYPNETKKSKKTT